MSSDKLSHFQLLGTSTLVLQSQQPGDSFKKLTTQLALIYSHHHTAVVHHRNLIYQGHEDQGLINYQRYISSLVEQILLYTVITITLSQ